jgi:hypothetical protein
MRPAWFAVLLLLAACRQPDGGFACGITALAGATKLLDEFGVPLQTLSQAPTEVPPLLPVRMAAGAAFRGLVTPLDSASWQVSVEGAFPSGNVPAFAVLVVGPDGNARGVMLYGSLPVRGAPQIGLVIAGALSLPLLGLQTDVAGLEDPGCPFFPDSLRQP